MATNGDDAALWFWKADGGSWELYHEVDRAILESALLAGETSVILLHDEVPKFECHLRRNPMRQQNLQSGHCREILRGWPDEQQKQGTTERSAAAILNKMKEIGNDPQDAAPHIRRGWPKVKYQTIGRPAMKSLKSQSESISNDNTRQAGLDRENQAYQVCNDPQKKAAETIPHIKNAKQSAELALDMLGVSVYHAEQVFLEQEVCVFTDTPSGQPLSASSTIYDIENLQGPPGVIRRKGVNTKCPLDGKLGAAYVHCLEGADHVGDATHMLSYSWNSCIGDIVDTLSDFCRMHSLDPKRTYIWICCLCVNQHRVVETAMLQKSGMIPMAQADFFTIFGERVKRIGHVLCMMAPWKTPVYLTRVWCIFEVFTALTNGCKVDIVMPPNEKESLEQDVIKRGGGINALFETLGSTKVQEAKASVERDRRAILDKVKSGAGYQELNKQVNNLLREWMLGVLIRLVETRENTNDESQVEFCNTIGAIFRENGEHDTATELFFTALSTCKANFGDKHHQNATTYNNIGDVYYEKGDYDGALAMYQQALEIRVSLLGKRNAETATIYNNIGLVMAGNGDYDASLAAHMQALDICETVLGRNHPDTAATYHNSGYALHSKGDYDGALANYKQALSIRESVLGKDHPETATTYNIIGAVLFEMGDYERALGRYEEALRIQESVLGENHPDTAATYNNIGSVMGAIGDSDGALARYEQALDIRKSVWGETHHETADSYLNIASVLWQSAEYDGALAKLRQAAAIQEAVLGKNHPHTAGTYRSIGLLLSEKGDYDGARVEFEKCLPDDLGTS
ncbi:Kinesin light chain [Seminavis robusta]|uniref:Kinesin light chain n=1 Tax=Seminavis robusta TaxID=568900 RepID=A0A9N8HS13_9STRA|nr:Kinesin light chain [Seminavis robusta]|eukprot:Sro1125_g243910.1 Kinesin light chain (802) ;mRNA; r:13842-16247